MLVLSVLGPFEASLHGEPLAQLSARKAQALLVYPAVEAHHAHQREALMTLLWPGYPLKSAQRCLRQTLYLLRQAIEPDERGTPLIISDRSTVAWHPDADWAADVAQFEALSREGHSPEDWQRAAELDRGDFLADFFIADSETFDTWTASKRAFYRRRMQALLRRLAGRYLETGQVAAAEAAVQRQLSLDNLDESAQRQLMQLMALDGRRQQALAHYDALCQLLQLELGIEPAQDTVALVEAIRAGELIAEEPQPDHEPALRHNEPRRAGHNLPYTLTSIVGRQKEITTVSGYIAQHRLVTLTGVGGIGKTALSIEVGHRLLGAFPDGVWLVELAPVADETLVAPTTAYALGLRQLSDYPILDALVDFLAEKRCLLILDNCEYLIQGTARFVQSILQRCPALKILASSRETLGVPGEKLFQVPPLSVPQADQMPVLPQWHHYESSRLFVERAVAVHPEFQPRQDNLASLVQICRRLEGIPLALELAAAWANVLTTGQILARLDDRFSLLVGGGPTTLAREQTLQAAVDWSWDLLANREQMLMQRLSVFAGGMNLESVEAICAGDGVDAHDIPDLLKRLVNKSLAIARRQQGGEMVRYRLLETIRQYAREQLSRSGSAEVYGQRHLIYFLHWAIQVEPELVGPGQATTIERLERELDNIWAALKWASETDRSAGLRLASALWRFWELGYAKEGEAWLAQLLAQEAEVEPDIRAKALWVQGRLNCIVLSNHDVGTGLAEQSLALYRAVADQNGAARCLFLLGRGSSGGLGRLRESETLFRASGDKLGLAEALMWQTGTEQTMQHPEQTMANLRESESLYRELGDWYGIARVLSELARVAWWRREYECAHQVVEEILSIEATLGTLPTVAFSVAGIVYWKLGDYEQACFWLHRCLTQCNQIGDRFWGSWASMHLGHVLLEMGEMAQARKRFEDSLQRIASVGKRSDLVYAIEGLARLAIKQKEDERAVRLIAWCDASRAAIHDPRPPNEQADVDRDISSALARMDQEAYAACYEAGRIMTTEQAVTFGKANDSFPLNGAV